ncbi:hypothetical protein BST81_22840 [Leptolyngbya sp. 'hensonii']|uniref:hybrid sensor histidine kinase/response regulator n=1 Tax=Leptolyngbya sp. 'hensonii' TaxID=1922337 RepID=UPI00095022A1|nr:response regulator [Leptolyngbya sp. 'hensonii']OLP16068.1 hypothetical protein BST81_22840 [Leptolyngbya sp. 'hensonii']
MTDAGIQGSRILIVDDSPNNLKVLCDVLEQTGWEIRVATDGESALQQVAYSQPDLILLDVMMPGMDGLETCRRLKADPALQKIPVMFITALADVRDKAEGYSLGAVDYITKPFDRNDILARIQTQLKIAHLNRQIQAQNAELQQLQQDLEQRVLDRTAQLATTLQELQQRQMSLLDAEKLFAMGALVAGLAYEMDMSLGAITTNLDHTSNYIRPLIALLRLYQTCYPNPDRQISQKQADMNLSDLIMDLPRVVATMTRSSERLTKLVRSIRQFSQPASNLAQPVDLHEGLDGVLLLLAHRLKGKPPYPSIQVVKEYGSLPPIVCYGDAINQVFLNLLVNALDALEDAWDQGYWADSPLRSGGREGERKSGPTLTIQTQIRGNHVLVSIANNGPGMSAEARANLFQPMFTTKPIGKGTGLGLSLSRRIVEEKQGGVLRCLSDPDQGTEFQIELPLQPAV